ncbi:MAG: toxic anion resistance protein [Alphaproteobacteria bacterium TMED89]|nr:toxic anion resistance protein [Rhodospirillaceae bacterium]RPH13547.1 MAG: toxic anion resistance protein [Alphaproteobacteria bacterium TMED89]
MATETKTAVAEVIFPDVANDGAVTDTALVPVDLDDPTNQAMVNKYMSELDMSDTNSIIFFGSKAQQELTEVSSTMLEGMRNKDVGPAGDALTNMVSALKGFDARSLDPNRKPNFFMRLFGMGQDNLVRFKSKFDTVQGQVDQIEIDLEKQKVVMLTDIEKLDKLYDANLDYFHDLELWIDAGEQKLKMLDEQEIPALAAKAEETGEMLDAQAVRDLRSARDDLERRVHDLQLTRQVTMQSLPSIRLVQENDKALVNKINSIVVNTKPLWQQQLAQAIAIHNMAKTGQAVEAAQDLTNDLLKANADNLQAVNAQVREQIERGVFDIETVQEANDSLIGAINDSLAIADEAKKKRAEAVVAMQSMENDLKAVLKSASAAALEAGQSAVDAN